MTRSPYPRFGNLLMSAAALMLAASCSDQTTVVSLPAANDGSLVGELTSYMANYDDHSELVHKLLEPSGSERTLLFQTEPDLPPGTRLKVWAAEEGDSLRVLRYEALSDPAVEVQQQALVMGTPKPTRRWAFVLVNFGQGVNTTREAITPKLFDAMTAGSIRSYFKEVSYGLQDLDGEVFEFTTTANGGCDTGVAGRLRAMIPGQFSQYLWYFGQRQMGCGWAGLAQLGSSTRPSRDSWYNASNGCVVLVQEPGHNFGMVHSSAIRCTRDGAAVPLTLPDEAGATCTHNEYGNPYDPMGRGCYHMNGPQKAYQDWLSGCNVVKVGSSGTFTLFPIEKACNGVQLLQVPLPAPRTMRIGMLSAVITSYYLELRTPVGFDFKTNPMANLTPRVLVTIGGDIRGSNQSGGRNWLVDMTPTSMGGVADSALPVGMLYSDPAPNGPKFTVVSADMEKAVIKIELATGGGMPDQPGSGTCDNMMAFTAPGPATCNAAPATPATPATDAGAPPPAMPDAAPPAPTPPATPDAGPMPGSIDNPNPGVGGAGGPIPPAMPMPPPAPSAMPPTTQPPPDMPVTEPVAAGCSCSTSPGPSGGGGLALVGLFAAALLVRRRRR
jgi:MYXO-CTERM domain-containing protein